MGRICCHLYEKRWSEVLRFCLQVSELIGLLRAAWNPVKFNQGGGGGQANSREEADHGGHKFDIRAVTRVLTSDFFESYLTMVVLLNQTMEDMVI